MGTTLSRPCRLRARVLDLAPALQPRYEDCATSAAAEDHTSGYRKIGSNVAAVEGNKGKYSEPSSTKM
jgi:hypothetical protein